MKGQLWLSLGAVLLVSSIQQTLAQSNDKVAFDQELNTISDKEEISLKDILKKNPKLALADDPRFNKMLPSSSWKQQTDPVSTTSTSTSTSAPVKSAPTQSSTDKDEGTFEFDAIHSQVKKNGTLDVDYYYYYYDDDDDDNSTSSMDLQKVNAVKNEKGKLKLIKGDDSIAPPTTTIKTPTTTTPTATPTKAATKKVTEVTNNHLSYDEDDENNIEEDDYEDDIDEEEDFDDVADDEEDDDDDVATVPGDNPCPRECSCKKSDNDYMVATCSRLDLEVQKFSNEITDLEVVDVGPKYPIVLGENFFKKIGLKRVVTIKITNCTIETISPTAFNGVKDLFSVNLTNTGLDLIHPDTFVNNTKLRLLTLNGNDLSAMQHERSPYRNYMLNAPYLEELSLSRCNLNTLLPTAFNKMKNLVFINLADNGIETLNETTFDNLEAIEELDLSNNNIRSLPKNIFAKTALGMLHLKYNLISSSLDFVTSDLQTLDLSYCKIRIVTGDMFRGATGLQSLKLRGNGITKINQSAFMTMRNLRHIDLAFNNLEQIPSMVFLKNKDLDIIKLNNNPKLKAIPHKGFECDNCRFSTYFLDLSNCDISDLGVNAFDSMPDLSRLNLAWNNLQTIRKGVFVSLKKLNTLDLSSNLLEELDDMVFLHNVALHKLNLAGNAFVKVSPRVFYPTTQLTELDLSDCDLNTLWSYEPEAPILPKMKFLNVSNNDMTTVNLTHIQFMNNLKVFDISENPLRCDGDFLDAMIWIGKRKIIVGNPGTEVRTHAELKRVNDISKKLQNSDDTTLTLTYKVCTDNQKPDMVDSKDTVKEKEETQDESEYYDNYYDDIDDLDEQVDKNTNDVKLTESVSSSEKNAVRDLFVKELEVVKNVQENIIGYTKKPILDNNKEDIDEPEDDYDSNEYDEKVDVEDQGKVVMFVANYSYLWPILILGFSVILLLLIVGKLVSMLMKKRHERYRQAILASKNSIVYQKLSEDIGAASGKVAAIPKIHRYQPINQV